MSNIKRKRQTALYEHLSRNDEMQGESNSIRPGDKNIRSNKSSKRGSPYLRKTLFNVMGTYLKCAPHDEPVFQFLDRKRSEGDPFYVYMNAASNKFLRRYYPKVKDYLATLEDLSPVDMDSTGLQESI